MIGYPLDSVVTFNEGTPEYDRAVSSAPLRELIKRLFSDGVLPDKSTDLLAQYVGSVRVSGDIEGATDTYNVVVNPGFGICNGCLKLQENFYGLRMDTANTANPRIDTVVLRLDDNFNARTCTFDIVRGTEASRPTAPTLTRNSTVWEIGLANLYKPATVSDTKPITVTDTRLDPNRCGVISSISEFDTAVLYNQIQEDLAHFRDVNEAEFAMWFENLQVQLSGDVASNLQNQIGTLPQLLTANKANLVNAINEVFIGNIPSVPTRSMTPVASQSLTSNPIPTSWQEVVMGMMYQSNGYNITATGFTENHEAYKAFDNTTDTQWSVGLISGASLMIELPTAILVDKMVLRYISPDSVTVSIEYSQDGYEWNTDVVRSDASVAYGAHIITLGGNTAKYWRLNISASSGDVIYIGEWAISDYTITTYNANFVLNTLSNVVEGQIILVHIDPAHDATGVVSNSLNGVPIHSILQAGRKYELTYHTTYYTAKEVG